MRCAIPFASLLLALAACSPDPEPVPTPDPVDASVVRAYFAWPDDQIACVAKAAYFEARGEGEDGMAAVAHVVFNRTLAPSFPDTPCEVISQGNSRACQFSWMCDGKSDRPTNLPLYDEAIDIARAVAKGRIEDPTAGAIMFHGTSITPYWADSFERTAEVGGHVFYRLD